MSFLNGIVDENEEMLYLEQNDNYFDEMDDFSYENPNISGRFTTYLVYLLCILIYHTFNDH